MARRCRSERHNHPAMVQGRSSLDARGQSGLARRSIWRNDRTCKNLPLLVVRFLFGFVITQWDVIVPARNPIGFQVRLEPRSGLAFKLGYFLRREVSVGENFH